MHSSVSYFCITFQMVILTAAQREADLDITMLTWEFFIKKFPIDQCRMIFNYMTEFLVPYYIQHDSR